MWVRGLQIDISDRGMDKHHAHVVAAAETVRAWVIAQRAAVGHANGVLDDRSSLHMVTLPASPPPSTAPHELEPIAHAPTSLTLGSDLTDDLVAAAVVSPIALDTFATEQAVPAAASNASTGFHLVELSKRVGPMLSLAHPALHWTWRVALVAGVAAGVVWTVREYQARRVTAPLVAAAAPAPAPPREIEKEIEKERDERKPLPTEAPGRPGGRLQIDSDPPGAQIVVDGKDRGAAPVAIDGVSPGWHTVVFKSEKGTVQRTVTATAGRTTQVNEGIYSGWLHVSSPIELQVAADGRGLRLDDNHQVMLPPGSHTITLANRALGFHETRAIEITPGGTASIDIELPTALLTVTTSEPAQLSIDGDIIGNAPLTDHAAGIGIRDVTARSASGQVRHVTVTLPTEGARIDIDFSRP